MANDVTIVVEADLGDTLLKLELAKLAVEDLDHAGAAAGHSLGDDTNTHSFSYRLGRLRNALGNIGDRGPIGSIVRGFGNLASAMLSPIQLGADFAQKFEQVGTVGQSLIGVFTSLTLGLGLLAAAVAATVFVAESLASVLGTIVAILADLVAPVTLLTGLLGSLGVGFFIAGKRALDGGPHLDSFANKVATLGSMFHRTSTILAQRFLPYLNELADAGKQALLFLDKIIKLPLGQAFRMIDTQGVQMLGKFVDRVAQVVSKPIRLAFKVAFSDSNFSNMVADWWHRFTGFLFGYVERNPVTKLDILKGSKPTQHQVEGIFQPLIDWFNRHHFTRQGIKIGNQILNGILNSGFSDRLVTFFGQVFRHAMREALFAARDVVKQIVVLFAGGGVLIALRLVRALGPQLWSQVREAAQAAWNRIKDIVGNIWDWIVKKVESVLNVNIDWPSPPGWFMDLIHGVGGVINGGGSVSSGGQSQNIHNPQGGGKFRASVAGGVVVQHFHGIDPMTLQGRRQIGQITSKAIEQRWARTGR